MNPTPIFAAALMLAMTWLWGATKWLAKVLATVVGGVLVLLGMATCMGHIRNQGNQMSNLLATPAHAASVECQEAAKRAVLILDQVAAENGLRLNAPKDDAAFAAMMFETAEEMEAKGTCWMPDSMLRHLIANALNGKDS